MVSCRLPIDRPARGERAMTSRPSRLPPHQFKPGEVVPGRGRPKGSRAKISESFLRDVYEAWEKHGMKVLLEVIEKQPVAFMKTVSYLIPREWNIKHTDAFSEMSEDDLRRALEQVRSLISAGLGRKTDKDVAAEDGGSKSDSIH